MYKQTNKTPRTFERGKDARTASQEAPFVWHSL